MRTNLLHSFGKHDIEEYEWMMPPIAKDQVRVKTIMTGVCRSDIGAYAGLEAPMPFGQFGHEGLGEVVEVGDYCKPYIEEGTLVATFSDPAYADFYYARLNELVQVPIVHPKYILQPVACALNIWNETIGTANKLFQAHYTEPVLIIGSGFLTLIIAQLYKRQKLHVVGNANRGLLEQCGVEMLYSSVDDIKEEYSTIIDLSSKAENYEKIMKVIKQEGLLCYAATPSTPVTTNFFNACWKAIRITLPSPRSTDFINCMTEARTRIEKGELSPQLMWTKGYDRKKEFKQAFEDGLPSNRTQGYIRGYIKW